VFISLPQSRPLYALWNGTAEQVGNCKQTEVNIDWVKQVITAVHLKLLHKAGMMRSAKSVSDTLFVRYFSISLWSLASLTLVMNCSWCSVYLYISFLTSNFNGMFYFYGEGMFQMNAECNVHFLDFDYAWDVCSPGSSLNWKTINICIRMNSNLKLKNVHCHLEIYTILTSLRDI
jgi:hypothetical protein